MKMNDQVKTNCREAFDKTLLPNDEATWAIWKVSWNARGRRCADIANSIDSNRGNETEIAKAIIQEQVNP